MKTFLLKNDKNRIYFQNYERISAEEELKKLQSILKEKNITIGRKHEMPVDDLYDCEIETFYYCKNWRGDFFICGMYGYYWEAVKDIWVRWIW